MTREALLSLLQCRTDQIEILTQQAEHLHRSLERSERASSEAEMNASLARWEADKVRAEAEQCRVMSASAGNATEFRSRAVSAEELMEVTNRGVLHGIDEDQEIDPLSSDEPEVSDAINALKSFVEIASENREDVSMHSMLEGTVELASSQLRRLWLDRGVDVESQHRHLRSLADGVIRLCAQELRRHTSSRHQLSQHFGEFSATAESSPSKGTPEPRVEMLPQQLHGSLDAAPHRQSESYTLQLQLRRSLQDLLGLDEAARIDGNTGPVVERLKLLEGPGSHCLPGRADAASLVQQQDFDLLGVAEGSSRFWLQQLSSEALLALTQRLQEVKELHREMVAQFRKVDTDLRGHFAVLGAPVQQQEDFFASRGRGLPALVLSQRELLRLQHSARLRVAEGRVRMAELWMELGTPAPEQELVLQRLRACAERDVLSELRGLGDENCRLEAKIESHKEILRKYDSYAALDQQIQEFERTASDSSRLRGSSSKLLQEEQHRKTFRQRRERCAEELVVKLGQWEQIHNERFLHTGLAMHDSLRQDLDSMREKDEGNQRHSWSSTQLNKVSSQAMSPRSSSSHTSLASAQSATGFSSNSGMTGAGGGGSPSSASRSARGFRSSEAPGSRVLTSVPEQRKRSPADHISSGARSWTNGAHCR
jgi:hypothetical protein